MMYISNNEFPKPLSITSGICVSSCFFLLPAGFAFHRQLYLYGGVCTSTTFLSINHWRRAEDGMRRKIDRLVAILCFILYAVSGSLYCRGIYLYGYGVPIIATVIGSFMASNYMSTHWHPLWCYMHMFFHLATALSECLVVQCVVSHPHS